MALPEGHEFAQFWYESNAFFGNVHSMETLMEAFRYNWEESNNIDSVDVFLDTSTTNERCEPYFPAAYNLDFGRRREHTGKTTLRRHLRELGVLDKFLTEAKLITDKKK